ncbi:hypothetical protein ACH5RR_040406 [Cinchona calisaya]|uniref:Uncharacterized protein n=1 Tax=Cinchona calisaya TaxID=153742 RepID=A0ABD2XWV9_9GENT
MSFDFAACLSPVLIPCYWYSLTSLLKLLSLNVLFLWVLVDLVGDHCQLGPVIMCKKAARAGLAQLLFERLVLLGMKPVYWLSHRFIILHLFCPFISFLTLEVASMKGLKLAGSLQNGVTINKRQSSGIDFPWPVPNRPMFFYV